jgi:hypothetical protein
MNSQIRQEIPFINTHTIDLKKCYLTELPINNIFAIKYSYDEVRTNLRLNIFLEYVQIIKLGNFNTIMVNLENSKNFLNIHSKLCSLYNITNFNEKIIFIKFSDKISRLKLIPAKSSNKCPVQISTFKDLDTYYKDFYRSTNLKSKLFVTPIFNKNLSSISYTIIDGEISYPNTFIENSIKVDIHKVKLNNLMRIEL